MGQEQLAVAEIESGCLNLACHEFGLELEVVSVMRGVAGAVREDQCSLSAAAAAR